MVWYGFKPLVALKPASYDTLSIQMPYRTKTTPKRKREGGPKAADPSLPTKYYLDSEVKTVILSALEPKFPSDVVNILISYHSETDWQQDRSMRVFMMLYPNPVMNTDWQAATSTVNQMEKYIELDAPGHYVQLTKRYKFLKTFGIVRTWHFEQTGRTRRKF
jgi:hypothetical protein